MPLTGNIGIVRGWATGIRQLANPERHRELLTELGHDSIDGVELNFNAQGGPTGAWARKRIPDGKPVGEQSGALRGSYRVKRLSARAVTIGPTGPARRYANIFHAGRKAIYAKPGSALRFVVGGRVILRKMVAAAQARPIVPNGRLPASWERRYRQTATRWFHQTLRGR